MILLHDDSTILKIYKRLSDNILRAFEIINEHKEIKIDKKEVLKSLDYYFIGVTLSISLRNRALEPGEINFINNLTRYSDYFKDIRIDDDVTPDLETSNYIKDEALKLLKNVPEFAVMCVVIDERLQKNQKKDNKTFSKFIYEDFEELEAYLKEEDDDFEYLYSLRAFFEKRKVYY